MYHKNLGLHSAERIDIQKRYDVERMAFDVYNKLNGHVGPRDCMRISETRIRLDGIERNE